MISQNQPIFPLSIPNILNYSQNSIACNKSNFIIPPLIKNNSNRTLVDTANYRKEIDVGFLPKTPQVSKSTPLLQLPPLMRSAPPNNLTINTSQSNLTEEQYSSPQPLDFNNNNNDKPLPAPNKKYQCAPIKAKWTKDEDDILKEAISKHGTNNWSLISNEIPGRTGKQCRERWLNQLNPSLNKEHWLPHEDSVLTHYQALYGNCWSKISRFLPGRSPNSVKNRWSFLMRHNALQRTPVWF